MTNEEARAILNDAAKYARLCVDTGDDSAIPNYDALKLAIDALDAVRWRDSRYELPEKRCPVLDDCGYLVHLDNEGIWRYYEDDYPFIEADVPSWMPIPERDKSIPVKPPFDMWILCPICGHDPDFKDVGGFEPDPDDPPFDHWVGPSFCPNCGQAFDLSELNEQGDKPNQTPLDTFAPENQTDLRKEEHTAKVIVEEDEDWIYMTCSHCEQLLTDGDTDGYEWSGCVENYCQYCGAKFEGEEGDTE